MISRLKGVDQTTPQKQCCMFSKMYNSFDIVGSKCICPRAHFVRLFSIHWPHQLGPSFVFNLGRQTAQHVYRRYFAAGLLRRRSSDLDQLRCARIHHDSRRRLPVLVEEIGGHAMGTGRLADVCVPIGTPCRRGRLRFHGGQGRPGSRYSSHRRRGA